VRRRGGPRHAIVEQGEPGEFERLSAADLKAALEESRAEIERTLSEL
jgi:hypothetical protein